MNVQTLIDLKEQAKTDEIVEDGWTLLDNVSPKGNCDDQNSTVAILLAKEVRSLARFVPGLSLRGSIPQTIRCSTSGYAPRDIDLLIVTHTEQPLASILILIYQAISSHRDRNPVLFSRRLRTTVDVRTSEEMALHVSWYEWALSRLDAATVGLPFTIKHTRISPTLDDLLDYMEYLTFLGARQYTCSRGRNDAHETMMSQKLSTFIDVISDYPPIDIFIPTTDFGNPLTSFVSILRIIWRQRRRTERLAQRISDLRFWFRFWQVERRGKITLSTFSNERLCHDFMHWRVDGKPWVERDMHARSLWRELLMTKH